MMKTAHPLGQVHGRWRPIAQRLMEPFLGCKSQNIVPNSGARPTRFGSLADRPPHI